jgi:pyochelin biosynthesis protein PchC
MALSLVIACFCQAASTRIKGMNAMSEPAAGNDAWIRRFHPAAAGLQLVCFPHAGGSASFYFPLSAALHPQIEVLAVQYPGRQDRRGEEPIRDIHRLAGEIVAALRPWLTGRPAFFGHSMGAIVAFEVARRMEHPAGSAPVGLIASGSRAPSRRRDDRTHLRDDEGVLADLQRLSGTDPRLLDDQQMLRSFLPAIRGDLQAIETYVCAAGSVLACPITAFVGDRDPTVTLDEAQAWGEHTAGGFGLHVFDGGHFYLTAHPAQTIDRLRAVLPSGRP